MTLRHYEVFVTVCDTLNMTAAANKLYMSQSAVSQTISEMERYYGIKLFDRLSKKLYLTKAGETLLNYARHILRMNLEAEHDVRSLLQNAVVRIGVSVTIGSCVLPKFAEEAKQYYPSIALEVIENNTAQIEALILKDKLDMAFVEGNVVSKDIVVKPFMQDSLVLIYGKSHRFSGRAIIYPSELEKENFILRETGSGTRKIFEDRMASQNINWHSAWTCNNADTIKAVVAQGLGISVISKRAVERELIEGYLYCADIEGLAFEREFKIIYHKNKYLTPSMEQLIALCYDLNDV